MAGERLWDFIKYKLQKLFTKRNYNRVIAIPSVYDIYPKTIQQFLVHLEDVANSVVQVEQEEIIESELEEVKGFINVKDKKEEIRNRLKDKQLNDKVIQEIASKLGKILE